MTEEATTLRIALAQVNVTVGDIEGNARLIAEWIASARERGADLVVFPEQAVTGYPAEDLWLKPHFLDAARRALEEIASTVDGLVAIVGFPERDAATYNSAAVLADGAIRGVYRKLLFPTTASSTSGATSSRETTPAVIEIGGVRVGLTICEDIWYPGPPASVEALSGREPDRQPVGVPVSPRQGRPA